MFTYDLPLWSTSGSDAVKNHRYVLLCRLRTLWLTHYPSLGYWTEWSHNHLHMDFLLLPANSTFNTPLTCFINVWLWYSFDSDVTMLLTLRNLIRHACFFKLTFILHVTNCFAKCFPAEFFLFPYVSLHTSTCHTCFIRNLIEQVLCLNIFYHHSYVYAGFPRLPILFITSFLIELADTIELLHIYSPCLLELNFFSSWLINLRVDISRHPVPVEQSARTNATSFTGYDARTRMLLALTRSWCLLR